MNPVTLKRDYEETVGAPSCMQWGFNKLPSTTCSMLPFVIFSVELYLFPRSKEEPMKSVWLYLTCATLPENSRFCHGDYSFESMNTGSVGLLLTTLVESLKRVHVPYVFK